MERLDTEAKIKEHTAKVFRLDPQNHWQAFEILPNHGGIVRDVAWAPNLGRFSI